MRTELQLTLFFVFVLKQGSSAFEECSDSWIPGPEGSIFLPFWSRWRPPNSICTYSLNVGRNNSVVLTFRHFGYPGPRNDDKYNCTDDWLTITCSEPDDENLEFSKRLCDTFLPSKPLRYSKCPVVKLTFFADSSAHLGPYVIRYTIHEYVTQPFMNEVPCGDTLFTESSGLIGLPTYLEENLAGINCTFTISANYTSSFEIDITSVRATPLLDSFENCGKDHIMIGCVDDGETELNPNKSNTYCRSSYDAIHSRLIAFFNCSMVKIVMLSSDYNYRNQLGFPFTVHAMVVDADCGNTSFTGPTGTIFSPLFPLSYPHGLDCVYTIDVDRTKTISFDFVSFNLEPKWKNPSEEACSHDWLKISCLSAFPVWENPSQEKQICGGFDHPITLHYSNCDSLTLNFVTDLTVSRGGFQIRYTITTTENRTSSTTDVPVEYCSNAHFTDNIGYIDSPRYPGSYPNNLDCVYYIDVDRKRTVYLSFLSFNVEGTSHVRRPDNCLHDWLLVSCLSTMERYNHSQKYCGEKETTAGIRFANCDAMTLNFVTDSSITGKGFQLKYYLLLDGFTDFNAIDCGQTLFTDSSGIIRLPVNRASMYVGSVNCTYTVSTLQLSHIWINTDFSPDMQLLKSFPFCGEEDITIGCSSDEGKEPNPNTRMVFCGDGSSPKSLISGDQLVFADCRTLQLTIRAKHYYNLDAFRIPYFVVGPNEICGNTSFTALSGSVSTQRYPWPYRSRTNCLYTIDSGRMNSVVLIIDELSFGPGSDRNESCINGSLTITCLVNETSVAHPVAERKLCGLMNSTTIRFPACRSLLLNFSSSYISNDHGLSVRYSMGDYSDAVVTTQMNSNGQRNHAVGISLTLTLLVTGVICLVAFVLFRRQRKKTRSEKLIPANEEETNEREMEDDAATAGNLNQDHDGSKYLPMRPM